MIKTQWTSSEIKGLKQGNSALWERFVRDFQGLVYSLCSRFTKNEEEQKELCAQIFAKAFTYINSFAERARLSTWFYRVAYHHLLSYARKSNKEQLNVSLTEMEKNGMELTNANEIEPCAVLDNESNAKLIAKALQLLPAKQKTAITLLYYKDMEYKEIAEVMDIPLGTVKTLIYRSKAKVRLYVKAKVEVAV